MRRRTVVRLRANDDRGLSELGRLVAGPPPEAGHGDPVGASRVVVPPVPARELLDEVDGCGLIRW